MQNKAIKKTPIIKKPSKTKEQINHDKTKNHDKRKYKRNYLLQSKIKEKQF